MTYDEKFDTVHHRNAVADAFRNGGNFDMTLYESGNGSYTEIRVQVQNGELTVKDVEDDMECIVNNMFRSDHVGDVIYTLARLLTPSQIECLLNMNRDHLDEKVVGLIPKDDGRGQVNTFLYYRNGENDAFHVITPHPELDVFNVDINMLKSIDKEETEVLLLDYEGYFAIDEDVSVDEDDLFDEIKME